MTTNNTPLADQLAQARGWDNLLRQLMLAGKSLHALAAESRNESREVSGCQSRVWLQMTVDSHNQVTMLAWSDSKIIRGVLAVIQEKVDQMSPSQLAVFDFDDWFRSIQLERYLSQSRASGIAGVVRQIRQQTAVSA
ncbi:SufE family protein [uncultured Alteromonas sp.]|jgi:cysteine desulfuration protein SufE|uniref:SufE family protein n=1 Tax=uncultured Alteromonas sp. TaxID=179113 RepID=UPI0025F2C7FC|nr:SufE family protein [uncultured Alteromonas sp.]